MSGKTRRRTKIVGFGAAAAVAFSMLSVGGANAAGDQERSRNRTAAVTPSVCTVTGYTPTRIVRGASTVKKTFSVQVSGCTLAEWFVVVGPFTIDDPLNTSGVAGNFALQTEDEQGNPVSLQLSPTIPLSPRMLRNSMAGKDRVAGAFAWGQEDPDDAEFAGTEMDLTLQRRATFGKSFNASPEPVKKGKKIKIKGTLGRINWNGAKNLKYVGFSNKAQIQFKASGTSKYVTVKTVTSTKKGKVNTTVKANKSGAWRLYFAGLSTTSSATSHGDFVQVK
jgi:hypothetical protein